MKNALWELQAIANQFGPDCIRQIAQWMKDHIGEAHMQINADLAGDVEYQKYAFLNAKRELGALIAEHSNMYPTFKENGRYGYICRMSSLYFKNEYGQEINQRGDNEKSVQK